MEVNKKISIWFKILIAIPFILFIFGCAKEKKANYIYILEYPKTISLKSTPISWAETSCPSKINVIKDLLIITDNCETDYLSIYDIGNEQLLTKTGRKGKGPNEFFGYPTISGQWIQKEDSIYFFLYDIGRRTFNSYNYNILRDDHVLHQNSVTKLPIIDSNIDMVYYLDNNHMVCRTYNDKGKFFKFEIKSEEISWWELPDLQLDGYVHPSNRISIDGERIQFKPDQTNIVGTYRYLKRIHIYDGNYNLQKVIIDTLNYNKTNLRKLNYLKDLARWYYSTPYLTNNYIYILDNNFTVSDYLNDNEKGNSNLLVLNWDGDLKCMYVLDKPLILFAIDEIRNKLYGIQNGNSILVYYDLRSID